MKALALHQPWASAMALGLKKFETRTRQVKFRGPLAIHATLKDVWPTVREAGTGLGLAYRTMKALEDSAGGPSGQLPKGAIVCVVDVYDCLPAEKVKADMDRYVSEGAAGIDELQLGDYSPGRWVILTRDVIKMETPVKNRGMQFIWNLHEEDEAKVLDQIK
jgi:hypothetical protein